MRLRLLRLRLFGLLLLLRFLFLLLFHRCIRRFIIGAGFGFLFAEQAEQTLDRLGDQLHMYVGVRRGVQRVLGVLQRLVNCCALRFCFMNH